MSSQFTYQLHKLWIFLPLIFLSITFLSITTLTITETRKTCPNIMSLFKIFDRLTPFDKCEHIRHVTLWSLFITRVEQSVKFDISFGSTICDQDNVMPSLLLVDKKAGYSWLPRLILKWRTIHNLIVLDGGNLVCSPTWVVTPVHYTVHIRWNYSVRNRKIP